MTKEFLVLHNPNHEIISFRLDKGVDDHIAKMSRHKQRRLIRCFSYNVALPSRQSVDLVKLSGLTVKEIKDSTEYLQMQNRFQVMYDSSLATEESVEAIEEPEDVDPVDADDIDGVLLEDKAETLDEIFEEGYPDAVEVPEVVEVEMTAEDYAKAPEVISPEYTTETASDTEVPVTVSEEDLGGPHEVAEPEQTSWDSASDPVEDIKNCMEVLESEAGVMEPEPEPEPVKEVKVEPKKKAAPKKPTRKKATKKKTSVKKSTKKAKK